MFFFPSFSLFFFQAEDGIRDGHVTGVQTCALPICRYTPGGEYLPMVLGVLIATAVSFAVSALILKFTGQPEGDLSAATAQMEEQKGRKSSVAGSLTAEDSEAQKALEEESTDADSSIDYANVDKIVFACDAGMGS